MQHPAGQTDFNQQRVILLAQRLSTLGPKALILARPDSGFGSVRLLRESLKPAGPAAGGLVDQVKPALDRHGRAGRAARCGHRHAFGATARGQACAVNWKEAIVVEGTLRPLRPVLRLIERSIDKRSQVLIVPELTLESWTISLPVKLDTNETIALYRDHCTHEQFHTEFKTDLDLTRLPSGKFDTNHLVGQLTALAMNALRRMGQRDLLGPYTPIRHSAKRRCIKTETQELTYRAGCLIEKGRRFTLGPGANDRTPTAFARGHGGFVAACEQLSHPSTDHLTNHVNRAQRASRHE